MPIGSPVGQANLQAPRLETVERSFDAKLHGHRYIRLRGRLAVSCQCLLAAAQNIKKIALALKNKTLPKIDGVRQRSEAAFRRPSPSNAASRSSGSQGGPVPSAAIPHEAQYTEAEKHHSPCCGQGSRRADGQTSIGDAV